jgi:PAS domain S-box-containing protein
VRESPTVRRSTPKTAAGSGRRASAKKGTGRTVRPGKKASSPPGGLSEERYKAFIENIDDGVYEVDLHGNFTYFNNALCDVFGHPRKKIQGQNFSKFMDEERARAAIEIFNEVYRTGRGIFDLIWEVIDQEGEKRIIELSANLIRGRRGEKIGFRGIARDVTERFKAQEVLRESEKRYQKAYEASRSAERRNRTLLDFLPYPMVVFTTEGKVTYLNPAFTETFGWTLEELRGKHIPYVPPELQEEVRQSILKLLQDRFILRHESRRLTKDGRILDVMMRGAVFTEDGDEAAGEMVLLRDITQEKRLQRINEALLRISTALPAYPDLEDLLDYISGEMKRLLEVEGALVILLDEEKKELFFLGAAYDDKETQLRAKEIRYPADRGVSGKVIRNGQPIIVHDTSRDENFYGVVDQQLGHVSHSLLDVPLRSGDRIIGVLCAINKKEGLFDEKDVELLNMIGGTVALSIENARFSKEITRAYREVSSLNRAKDRVINRLSHEMRTPVSVLMACLNILAKRLADLPADTWKPTLDRARRNLQRLLAIQYQVEDIMEGRQYKTYELLNLLLDQCEDLLEALAAEQVGEGPLVETIRSRIRELYGPRESTVAEISLHHFVQDRIGAIRPEFAHRQVELIVRLGFAPDICVPAEVLLKVTDGLIRNAIEATPDEGTVEILVEPKGSGAQLVVSDQGIGITEDNRGRIFEGFFTTQETMSYSSKRPFDFNAGGKGADLLRMKIFAERYNFRIEMHSTRCRHIPKDSDICPGRISQCKFCSELGDCHRSGGTTFTVFFPPAPDLVCETKEKAPL